MSVHIRVLGSIEIARDGQAIPLAGQGQRAVLGALALEHGRPVTVGRLAETIWQLRPPATSRTKIQAHVCALRRALGQPARGGCGPLLTTGPGYALCRECVQLDLAEFDALTAKGRKALAAGEPGPASELFADALALWRGPAFADAVSPSLRAAAGPLEERRVLTVEAKAEADLALGRPEVVAADLSAWLVAMPLRELMRGQLMLALYRLGCRADALSIYRAGHRIMIAEVGLEPGPQLRSLHQRLLADDPTLMEPLGARAQGLLLRGPEPSAARGARQLQRAPAGAPG
ncbi:MAG TPA: AfsR/SARP family transcriptional regulator [Streptosporangiaceae bacterium]|nr:AfsR/SARP family transcriptional regulator [Streptosporangiaceae bacterium]